MDANVYKEIGGELIIKKYKFKGIIKNKIYFFIKRTFDIILSSIGLIAVLPIFLIISIAIKVDSKGPIFFTHSRVGKDGKPIKIYKFRTMCQNAQNMTNIFSQEQLKEYKENYKLEDDPRLTKFGKKLRQTSLDELPQIFNILKGDLSIIGPRPIVLEELEKYGESKTKLLSVKPGLTGYWQVNGRSITTYQERMQMELYYVDNMSILLDTKIFFETFIAVIKKRGAM